MYIDNIIFAGAALMTATIIVSVVGIVFIRSQIKQDAKAALDK